MNPEDISVDKLLNIGPKTASWLLEIDVHTKKNLVDLGPVMVYKILKHRVPGVTTVLLYALYGAIHEIHWNEIPADIKETLKEAAKEDLDIGLG